jgi:hypothetical protein
MRAYASALVALTLALAPATVLACGMEFDFPMEDENDALLVALMEEIDEQLEEPAPVDKLQGNAIKSAEIEVVLAAETEPASDPDQS